MHEGLQYATLAILLFGILLNRYDVSALRKDIDAKLESLRKDMEVKLEKLDAKLESLRKDMDVRLEKLDVKLDRNRDEFLRRTDAIVAMQFDYAERIKALEVKGKVE